jgi:hypothetical protein
MTNLNEARLRLSIAMNQPKKGIITIFPNSAGLGKTTSMEKKAIRDHQVGTSSIIFSQEHKQLDRIAKELKEKKESLQIVILKGWKKICKYSNDKNIKFLMEEYGNVDCICNIKCPLYMKQCKYHTQFNIKGCNILLSPLEFFNSTKLKKLPINIYFDENPIKFSESKYSFRKSQLVEILNPSLFQDYIGNDYYLDFTIKLLEFCSDIQILINDKILKNIHNEIAKGGEASYINKNMWLTAQINNFDRFTLKNSLDSVKGYLFKILKELKNSTLNEDRKLNDLKNILSFKQVWDIVNKLIKQESYLIDFCYKDKLLTGFGVTFYDHKLKDIYKLSLNKKIVFLWATYEEFLIKSLLSNSYNPERFNVITDEKLNYNPLNKSQIFEIKNNYSFNRTNLNKDEGFWKHIIKFISLEGKEKVCVISPSAYEGKFELLGSNWIKNNFHYWQGGGIEGSNRFVGKTILLIIAKPELPERHFLLEYYKIFKRFPIESLEYNENLKRTVIKKSYIKLMGRSKIGYKDANLDNIYKYKTINPLKDGFGRLRAILRNDIDYKIYAFCPVPKGIQENCNKYEIIHMNYFRMISKIDLDFVKNIAQSIMRGGYFVPSTFNVKENRLMCEFIQENFGLPIVYVDKEKLIKLRRGYLDEVCDDFS